MKDFTVYFDNGYSATVSAKDAFTPRLEDAAEAVAEILVILRDRGVITDKEALAISGNQHRVYLP